MDKRYQIFVSSTFKDLKEERRQVQQAILELDHIPSGMELFPATDDDPLTLIKHVIDDCDYYMLIIAGHYGSIGKEGIGFTEIEYDYALSIKKPVIAFLHDDPNSIEPERKESDPERVGQLERFRKKAEAKLCKYWTKPEELGWSVVASLVKLIKEKPAEGWVRARFATDSEEILRLRMRIGELEAEIRQLKNTRLLAPPGTENYATGSDTLEIEFEYVDPTSRPVASVASTVALTWDDIIKSLCRMPYETVVWSYVMNLIQDHVMLFHKEQIFACICAKLSVTKCLFQIRDMSARYFQIKEKTAVIIKNQLLALGLMTQTKSEGKIEYYALTPYGELYVRQCWAIRKQSPISKEARPPSSLPGEVEA